VSAVDGPLDGGHKVTTSTWTGTPGEPPAGRVWRHGSLVQSVAPPTARTGVPEPVEYDPATRPDRAREAEVEAMVAAAKAEAARRWAAAGCPVEAAMARLPSCRGRMCLAWRRGRCDAPCWEAQ